MTIAELGLKVESGQVERATPTLIKLTEAARQAEAAANGLAASSRAAAPAMGQVASAANAEAAAEARATLAARIHTAAMQSQAQASKMLAFQQRNLVFQLNDTVVSLASGMNPAMVALQQGSQILQGGIGGLANAVGGLVTKFAPVLAVVAALGVGVAAMTTEINRNQKEQVSWTDVVAASWQLASESIISFFQPVIDTIGGWWDAASPMIAQGINNTIGTFVFAFTVIKDTWSLLPAAMGDIVLQSVNNVISGVQGMINATIDLLNNTFIKPIQQSLSSIGVNIGTIGKVNFGSGIANPFAGSADKVGGIIGADAKDAYSTNYLDAIGDRARKIASANTIADDTSKGLGKTIKGPLTDSIDQLSTKTNAWVEAAQGAFSNLGSGIIDAFKKGGDVVSNILDMLGNKVGQFGESLLNSGLNSLLNSIFPTSFIGGSAGSAPLRIGYQAGVGGLFGGSIIPGLLHSGGIAGVHGYGHGRSIGADAFINAPRYHSGGIAGLRPNEVPAILQKGERVIPVGGSSGQGGIVINFHNVSKADKQDLEQWASQSLVPKLQRAQRHPHRASI